MKCLDNFFGIKGICAENFAPRSGMWLEQLEGMSVKAIADIQSKYPNTEQLLKETLYFAGLQLMEDIKQSVFPDLYDNIVAETARVGVFKCLNDTDPDDFWPSGDDSDNGLRVRKSRTQFSKLKIHRLFFLANTTEEELPIKIKDGVVEKFITINVVAGQVKEVIIDYTAETDQVDITWNTKTLEVAKGSTYRTMRTKDCGCPQGSYEHLAGVGLHNGSETSELYGIAAELIIECDPDQALCLILNTIKMPLLYRWGIRLLDEYLASDRMNFLAIHNKEWAAAKRQEWWEVQYMPLLEAKKEGIKNFLKRVDPTCFSCGGLRYGYVHP